MNEPVIELQAVKKSFGGRTVLADLTLAVPVGQTFAFLGCNGAGKTTTIRMLLGLLRPDGGRIRVLGLDPAVDGIDIRRRVGYLAEDQAMFGWMRVEQLIGFTAPFYPTWDAAWARDLAQRFELPMRTRIRNLSKGQTVRVGLLLALAHRPRLVILDDPTLGLDPIMRKDFLRDLVTYLQSITVFFSSHLLYEVEPVADAVAILHRGRIVRCAATEELREKVKRLILPAEAANRLESLPGILDIRHSARQVAVIVEDVDAALAALRAGVPEPQVVDLNLDPPLNWLSLPLMLEASSSSGAADIPLLPWRVGYTPQHILYVLGMLAICALSALGAWQAVRRGWRIEADRKLMYWSIGLAALLLVWSAAYQVGSNLPVEQEVVLPGLSGDPRGQRREVLAIAISGDRGAVLTCRWPGVTRDAELWPFEMTSEGVGLRERIPIELPDNDTLRYGRPWFSISDDGRYAYLIGQRHTMDENGRPMVSHPFLYTVAMQGGDGSVAHQLPLSSEPRGDWVRAAHRMGDRMYVATSGGNLLSIDLTDAAEPMLVWQRPWLREGAWAPSPEAWQAVGFRPGAFASPWVWPLRARLLELEGFTPRQRLEATVVLSGLTYCGDILAFMSRDGVAIARLRSLTNTEAVFEFAGEYRRTAIQHMLEDSPVVIAAEGNLLYARTQSGFGAHAVSVFDVADPQRPLRVGHFAMPSAYWFEPRVAPLPDGRAVVVGGDRLFVTGRPRVRSRN